MYMYLCKHTTHTPLIHMAAYFIMRQKLKEPRIICVEEENDQSNNHISTATTYRVLLFISNANATRIDEIPDVHHSQSSHC